MPKRNRKTMKNIFRNVFFRNVTATFSTMVLTLVLSFATSIIVARILGPEKKGILTLVLLLPNMMVLFLNGGINVSNTYFAGSRRFDVKRLFESTITFAIISTALAVILAIIFIPGGLEKILLPGVPQWAILVALVIFPFALLSTLLSGLLQGLEKIVELNRIQAIQAGISFLLTCLMVVFFHLGLLGALIAAILASTSGTVGFAFLLKGNWTRFIPSWHSDVIKASLSFGLRGYIANILQFFNYRLDVLIVNIFLGPAAVGIYAVSYGIAELIWNLPDAVSFVFFPRIVSDQRQKRKSTTLQILAITVAITLIGALFLAIIGRFLISFLYTDIFKGAYFPLLALLPGVVLLGAAKVLTAEILGRGYPQYNSILSGVGLVMTVIGDLILIPGYGILGAAIASSLSYCIIFLMSIGFYLYLIKGDLLIQGTYN